MEAILGFRYSRIFCVLRTEGVAWNNNVLLADPPPFAMNKNLYSFLPSE